MAPLYFCALFAEPMPVAGTEQQGVDEQPQFVDEAARHQLTCHVAASVDHPVSLSLGLQVSHRLGQLSVQRHGPVRSSIVRVRVATCLGEEFRPAAIGLSSDSNGQKAVSFS